MSVDLSEMQWMAHQPRQPVKNLLVFFGGYDPQLGMAAGNPLTHNDSHGNMRTCYRAYLDLAAPFRDPSTARGWDPDLRNNDYNAAVRNAAQFVYDNFDPLGRLVIYGYSAGGFLALRLCERISKYFGWYSFDSRKIGAPRAFTPTPDSPQYAPVKIDLLVTVDPCMEDSPDPHPPTQAPGVRHHENFWQHQPRSTPSQHYWGCSLPGSHDNPNLQPGGNSWHDAMPMFTLPAVRQLLRNELSLQGTCFSSY